MDHVNPELFKKVSNILQTAQTIKLFEKYSSKLKWKNGDTIIDIGCGPGDFTANIIYPKISSKIKEITATDISEKMLECASKNCSNNPKLKFDILDIEGELPEKFRGQFDHVFSSFCIQTAKDQRKVLKNFYDLLKPGGDTLFWLAGPHPQIILSYVEMAKDPKWKKYMTNVEDIISVYENEKFPEFLLRKILEEVGFQVELCENVSGDVQFPDEQSFKDFVESINPFVKNMPKDVKDEYMDQYFEKVQRGDPIRKKNVPNMYYSDALIAYAYKV